MMLLNYIMHVSNAYADRVFKYSGSEVMLSVFSVRFGRSQLLFYVPVLDFICRTSNSVIRVLNSIIRVSNLDLLNPGH